MCNSSVLNGTHIPLSFTSTDHIKLSRNSYTHIQWTKNEGGGSASLEIVCVKILPKELSSTSVLTEAPNLLSEKAANCTIDIYHYSPFEAHPKHL